MKSYGDDKPTPSANQKKTFGIVEGDLNNIEAKFYNGSVPLGFF